MDPVEIAEWIQMDPYQNGKLMQTDPVQDLDFEFGGIGDYG